MPRDAPVTSATLPLSDAVIEPSPFMYRSVRNIGGSWRLSTTIYIDRYTMNSGSRRIQGAVHGSHAKGATEGVQLRRGARQGAARVLEPRVRRDIAIRSHRGDGHQPPQPLRGLRQQG